MEIIELQGLTELKARENLPEVPELIQQYLALKKKEAEGKYFRVTIEEENRDSKVAGMAYLNELRIEKREGNSWTQVYNTGMMQYRGAYNYEIDNWDLSLNNATIFNESESEVVYALCTGIGNVKVYHFRENGPELLASFNISDYKSTQKRIELLQKITDDAEAFCAYVSSDLGHRWHTANNASKYDSYCKIFQDGRIVALIAKHSDRDYDAITDLYKIYIWVKGKGFGVSSIFNTGLHHPGGKFYSVSIGFDATLTNQGHNFFNLSIKVKNRSQAWNETRNFRVQWEGSEPTDFECEVGEGMEYMVQRYRHNHPLYKPTLIIESSINAKQKIAAWILFEQIDTDRLSSDGEGWLGDQFRYSLWAMKAGQEPQQLYEEHDYIRPWSKSTLTGTRGRDCSLKALKLESDVVKITHLKGERIEQQEPEELTFNL